MDYLGRGMRTIPSLPPLVSTFFLLVVAVFTDWGCAPLPDSPPLRGMWSPMGAACGA